MRKVAFFAFRGKKMCFTHLMLNALEIKEKGGDALIIFEGEACKLPKQLVEEENPLYKKCKERGIIAGVCKACSKSLGVYEDNKKLDIEFLSSLNGHPSMNQYLEEGYEIVTL